MTLKIVVITGGKGTGKTTTAATIGGQDGEKKTVIFDIEDSTSSIETWFTGKIINAHTRFRDVSIDPQRIIKMMATGRTMPYAINKHHLADIWWWLIDQLQNLPKGTETVVIDTWEPIEASLQAAIEAKPEAFGWSKQTDYGKKTTEGFRPAISMFRTILDALGVSTLILNTHVKPAWIGPKPVPGKVIPAGNSVILSQFSSMWLWMVNDGGTPAALVLKSRLEKRVFDDNGFAVIVPILPRRIPAPFSWAKVASYRDRPADMMNPEPGEVPTALEMEMMSQMLTSAQMKLMIATAQQDVATMQVSAQISELSEESIAKILELHAEGVNDVLIAVKTGEPLAVVRATISGSVEKGEDE